MWVDMRSQPLSFKLCRHYTNLNPVMVIRDGECSFSLIVEVEKKRGGSRFKSRNKNINTTTTVAPIVPQRRPPVNQWPENAGFCRFCTTNGPQAEKYPVILLQVRLNILQQRQNKKSSLPYRKNWLLPWGPSPYYRELINPSYRYSMKLTVVCGVNSRREIYQVGSLSSRPVQKNYKLGLPV